MFYFFSTICVFMWTGGYVWKASLLWKRIVWKSCRCQTFFGENCGNHRRVLGFFHISVLHNLGSAGAQSINQVVELGSPGGGPKVRSCLPCQWALTRSRPSGTHGVVWEFGVSGAGALARVRLHMFTICLCKPVFIF